MYTIHKKYHKIDATPLMWAAIYLQYIVEIAPWFYFFFSMLFFFKKKFFLLLKPRVNCGQCE